MLCIGDGNIFHHISSCGDILWLAYSPDLSPCPFLPLGIPEGSNLLTQAADNWKTERFYLSWNQYHRQWIGEHCRTSGWGFRLSV